MLADPVFAAVPAHLNPVVQGDLWLAWIAREGLTALALPPEALNGRADSLTRDDFARHAHELKVTADDAKAMQKTLELLMGRSVENRREWLMGNGWRGEQE